MISLTCVNIEYMNFCFCQWKWNTDLIFRKTDFNNSKKLESIVNVFVFFIKASFQSKEFPPFLNNPAISSLIQPHPFWKKYFIPSLLPNHRNSIPPFVTRSGFQLWIFNFFKELGLLSSSLLSSLSEGNTWQKGLG